MFMPGVWFLWSKKNIIFQKEKGNTFTLLIIFIVVSLQNSKMAQFTYYEHESARINLQSSHRESTRRRLTLCTSLTFPDASCDLSMILREVFGHEFPWNPRPLWRFGYQPRIRLQQMQTWRIKDMKINYYKI